MSDLHANLLISYLLDLKEPTSQTQVFFSQLIGAVHNCGSTRSVKQKQESEVNRPVH